MKICSVTILYKPYNNVADYIASYAPYISHLYIVDNGNCNNDSLITLISQKSCDSKIQYLKNKDNTGIAASLNLACNLAIKDGFDWILTMDQDSYFESPDFFVQSAPLLIQQNIGIVAASYYGKLPYKKKYSSSFDQLLIALTSGNLVNLQAWRSVNGFDGKLFIDEVDNDFCLRLKKEGLLVLGSKQILLSHSLGQEFSIQPFFAKKSMQIGIHAPFRMYFTVRNGLYVSIKYFLISPYFAINRWKNIGTKLLLIICFYPDKRKYLNNFFKGMFHFFTHNFKYNPIKNQL